MMRLKQIDIFGFKSFCDRTSLVFGPGITVIVGPNGCGKSNIADAVLWVLGEQSPRSLRSGRMEDVLFNGSERRRPLGMAEVSLTLEELEPSADATLSRYREVCITRRLYRSGESEYLLNKAPCRLKDIRDLLLDLGASFKGHGIMEQGRVDEMITASPQERRAIIEETAGITKYKLRKTEAERKLDSTQQNLLRVRDIIQEVKRQLNHLDRQARKAETFSALQSETRDLELRLLVLEGRSLTQRLLDEQARLSAWQSREATLLAGRSALEADIEGLRVTLLDRQRHLEQLQQAFHREEAEMLRTEHRILSLQEQQRDWQEQAQTLGAEIEQTGAQMAFNEEKIRDEEHRMEGLIAQLGEHRDRLHLLEQQHQAMDLQIQDSQRGLEEARTRLFEQQTAIIQLQNRRGEAERRVAEIRNRIDRNAELLVQLEQKRSERQSALASHRAAIQDRQTRLNELQNRIVTETERLRDLEQRLQAFEGRLTDHRGRLVDIRSRHATLQDQLKRHVNLQEGAREILTMAGTDRPFPGLLGVLADLIETDPLYEKALDAVLRERLGGLILEDQDTIDQALGWLKQCGAGEATLIPRRPRRRSNGQDPQDRAADLARCHPGVLGHARRFVRATPASQEALDLLLQDVLVVQDLATAYALREQGLWEETLVSLSGEVLEGSNILYSHSVNQEKKGLLEQRREVRDLETAIADLETEVLRLEEHGNTLRETVSTCQSALEDLQQQRHAAELETVEASKQRELLEQELGRVEEQIQIYLLEQQQADAERQELEVSVAQSSEALRAMNEERSLLESDLQQRQKALEDLSERRTELGGTLTGVKMTTTALEEKLAGLGQQLEQLRARQVELARLHATRQQRLENLNQRRTRAEGELHGLAQLREELAGKKAALVDQIRIATEEVTHVQDRLHQVEDQARLNRTELETAQQARQQAELLLTELRLKMDRVRERVQALAQEGFEATEQRLGAFEEDEAVARARLEDLRRRLDSMGPVNLASIEEYRELQERYAFLTGQEQDLTESMESLKKAIEKINQTTRTLFLETFEALNAKFAEMFTRFFEGGTARLVLLDPLNPLDSGLDIVAQPPGKRLRHLHLLSGGEKALTSIALLFSSFLIHPAPFCILDEIDAALDEENVRRFSRMLSTLAHQSQFILVTHNKRTMEMADVLYGVTMEEPGCSKIVSVKLTELAGRQA